MGHLRIGLDGDGDDADSRFPDIALEYTDYQGLSHAMNSAVDDPIAADKAVRQMTGLDTLGAVELVGGAIQALGEGRSF